MSDFDKWWKSNYFLEDETRIKGTYYFVDEVKASYHGELWNCESYNDYLNFIIKFSKSWCVVLESGLFLFKNRASQGESAI